MQPLDISLFLKKYFAGIHTEAEHQQFTEWLLHAPISDVEKVMDAYHSITPGNHNVANDNPLLAATIESALDQYELGKVKEIQQPPSIGWRTVVRIAAMLILAAGSATLWFSLRKTVPVAPPTADVQPAKTPQNDLPPGSNKATLTLSNGAVINLDDTRNGQIARQGNTIVDKYANGQLVYQQEETAKAEVVYNTLTTPRGGQFKLVLPDGSEVWLNAASTIKYPTSFPGKERKVDIQGEAYFEIAHNASQPFIVNANGMEVKVLGTHFNINAYNDESLLKTSLLEGSISLSKNGEVVLLTPGQQARLAAAGPIKVINDVDMEEVIAWKNGYFSFNRADLKTVMRQIARWYDVDISYEGQVPERSFGGKIDRNNNASEVLRILKESKVHFSIDGKKIIVKP